MNSYNYTAHFRKHGLTKDEYFKEYHPTIFKFTIQAFGEKIEKKLFKSRLKKNPKFDSLTFSQTKFLLFLYSIDKESISIRWKWIDHAFNYWMKEYTFKEIQERWLALVKYDGPKADSKEYLIMLYGDTEGSKRYREKQDRVTGENNPAYDHGGKFSPFSKKFIKYENLTDEQKEITINELVVEADKTRNENDNVNTRVEFWLKRGYSEDEAKKKLRERQSTFTLEKCVDELGEDEGLERWLHRQNQWQSSLKDKTTEEIARINQLKGHGINAGYTFQRIKNGFNPKNSIAYYLRIYNDDLEFWKIGITSYTVEKRFGNPGVFKNKYGLSYEILDIFEGDFVECFLIEQSTLKTFKDKRIRIEHNNFTSGECFSQNVLNDKITIDESFISELREKYLSHG